MKGNNMAKRKIVSDFEEMREEQEDFEFDDEDFGDIEDSDIKRGRRKSNGHAIFFALAALVLVICGVSLMIWNRGEEQEDIEIDESEFDTEPNDYIQPMTSDLMAGKPEDDVTTILALGNSPFADDGDNNLLAAALRDVYGATVINASVPDSYQARSNPMGDTSDPYDGVSLVSVVEALTTGNLEPLEESAKDVSDSAYDCVCEFTSIDMTHVDCVVIFYDLSDYIAHRNIYNPDDEDDVTTFCGALSASIKMIQEKYPYIRIVVLSTPACGKTIDDYYVDATIVDLANGTLPDYIGNEITVCATRGVSFVDLYFGAIHVDNRDRYLVNDYHLNAEGAKVVAQRMAKLIIL